ncbi:MAG: response regulator, partial [Pseudomonadota bacterium]
LGLSIVKRLSELQDHQIGLSSTPNEGSKFSITIPAASCPERTSSTTTDVAETSAESQKVILTIENEVDISEAMTVLLSAWGYTVLTAEDSAQAFSIAEHSEHDIDLLISDYQLDDKENGLALCQRLQEMLTKKVPIIIVTGNTDSETIKQMEQSDITLLHKPVFPPQLRLAIENNLRRARV